MAFFILFCFVGIVVFVIIMVNNMKWIFLIAGILIVYIIVINQIKKRPKKEDKIKVIEQPKIFEQEEQHKKQEKIEQQGNIEKQVKKLEQEKIEQQERIEKWNSQEKIELEHIKNEIKKFPVFNNGKIIEGYQRNRLVFAQTGEIGILDGTTDLKMLNIKDINSIRFEYTKFESFCIFSLNDFNNPILKFPIHDFDRDNKETCREIFDEIKSYYLMLKKKIKSSP